MTNFRHIYISSLLFLSSFIAKLESQIVIPNSTFTYSQDFNTLANTGTSSTLPLGWAFFETGTSANTTYTAGTGSTTTGDTYSFGPASNTERCFGGLQSGPLIPTIGVCFKNSTGSVITSFRITYTGETWRVGTANRPDSLKFQYRQNTFSISSSGTWLSFQALDYWNPGQATGSGTMQHSTIISSTISGLNLAADSTFCLRWNDFNASSFDDGMGIDDFTIDNIVLAAGLNVTQSNGSTNVSESGVMDTCSISLNTQPIADVTININPDAQTSTQPSTLTFTNANWNQPQIVKVIAEDDLLVEGNHSSSISIISSSSDASYNGLSNNSLIAQITDNDACIPTLGPEIDNIEVCEGGSTRIITPDANIITTFPLNAQWVFDGEVIMGAVNAPSSGFVSISSATLGSGLTGPTFPAGNSPSSLDAISASNWTSDNSTDINDYFEFCLSANLGYKIDLSSIAFDALRSSTGPQKAVLAVSVNGGGFNNISPILDIPTGFTSNPMFTQMLSISDATDVCIRLYGYGSSGTSGTFRLDNVRFVGLTKQAGNYKFFSSNPTVNPLATLLYTGSSFDPGTTILTSPDTIWVTYKNPLTGCETNADSVLIKVLQRPLLNIIQPTPVCFPGTVNINSVTLGNSPPGGVISYYSNLPDAQAGSDEILTDLSMLSQDATIYVRYELSNGCYATGEIKVKINSKPEIPIVPDRVISCQANNILISVKIDTSQNSYTWDFENGITGSGISSSLIISGNGPPQNEGTGLSGINLQSSGFGCSAAITSTGYDTNNTTLADAITDEEYFEFCAGSATLAYSYLGTVNLRWNHRRSDSGPVSWAIVSSDALNTILLSGTVGTSCSSAGGVLQLNPSACYRIYYWGASSASGALRIDNFEMTSKFIKNVMFNWYDMDPILNPGAMAVFTGPDFTPTLNNSLNPNEFFVSASSSAGCKSDIQNIEVYTGKAEGSILCKNYNFSLGADCNPAEFTEYLITNVYNPTYDIKVKSFNGKIISKNEIKNYLGQELKYEVKNQCSGNTCWGIVKMEDKLPPELSSPRAITVFCWDEDGLFEQTVQYSSSTGLTLSPALGVEVPTVTENCGLTKWKFSDVLIPTDDKCNILVRRTWEVTDCGGNKTTTSQTITLVQPNWTMPSAGRLVLPKDVTLSCESTVAPLCPIDDIGAYHPEIYAAHLPILRVSNTYTSITSDSIDRCIFAGSPGLCNYFTSFSDKNIHTCGDSCLGNRKVIRTWLILDWCNGAMVTHIQIINLMDQIAPTGIGKDTAVTTRPWDCTADAYIPDLWELYDNCDLEPVVNLFSTDADVTVYKLGNRFRARGLKMGANILKWTLKDCCGNERTINIIVTVNDNTAPVAVVKQGIVLSLTPGYESSGIFDAQAKLFAASIDNGSYDHCSQVRVEIRRSSSPSNCGNIGRNGTFNNNRTFSDKFPASFPETGAGQYSAQDDDNGLYVVFCCTDLDAMVVDVNGDGKRDEGYSEVILRVWDDANNDGCLGCWVNDTDDIPYPLQDNYNDTWAYVKVECKVPPVITKVPDIEVECDEPIDENFTTTWKNINTGVFFGKTGIPQAYAACETPAIEYRDAWATGFPTQCGLGKFTRTFRAISKGITVTSPQIIEIDYARDQDGNNYWTFADVAFPKYGATTQSAILACLRELPEPRVPGIATAAGGRYHVRFPVVPCNPPFISNNAVNYAVDCNQDGYPDAATTTCAGPTAADILAWTPKYLQGPCDVIGLNTTTEKFSFENGVCMKWLVTYNFMNWCTNECATFKKDFMFVDNLAPVITCADLTLSQGAGCVSRPTLTKSATDDGGCAAGSSDRWLKWEISIDEWGDGTIDAVYSSFVPSTGTWATTWDNNLNGIPTKYMAPSAPGANITIIFKNEIAGKFSKHKIGYKVADGCHNYTTCSEVLTVTDLKPPTPYCIHLSTSLMAVPAGSPVGTAPMVEIWARDFDRGADDGCTDPKDLRFTFDNGKINPAKLEVDHYFDDYGEYTAADAATKYRAGELQKWNPASKTSGMIFTTPGKRTLKVTVLDWNLNPDYCEVELTIVCNGNGCPPSAGSRIAGNVHTEAGQGVMNAAIIANAALPEYPKQEMTDELGDYGMDIYTDTELKASKDGDDVNGVSTLDLVIIQRHILGIQPITSPYQMIAADANNDGKVTAMDLTDIRKVIMGMTDGYQDNTSWRFPIENQVMNADKPFPYLESMMATLATANGNYNFIAVKIGDVSGNATSGIANSNTGTRSDKKLTMAVEEQMLAAGEVVEIPVISENCRDITGFQYTMHLKGGAFVGIISGALEMNEANVGKVAKDKVTMSYAGREGITLAEGTVLFTIVVKADRAVKASEMISIGSAVTPAESYTSNFEVGKVSLEVRTAPVTAIQLHQNEPNPFKGQTSVSFNMIEAATATISVYDVTGKVVSVRNIHANKGLNSEIFTRDHIGSAGVFYYTLTTCDFSATRKMIRVE